MQVYGRTIKVQWLMAASKSYVPILLSLGWVVTFCVFCWDQHHNSFTFTRIYIHTHAFQKIHFLMGLWKPSRVMFQNLSLGNLVCYLTCVVFSTDFKWTADVDHNLQMMIIYFYFTDIRNRLDMFPCKTHFNESLSIIIGWKKIWSYTRSIICTITKLYNHERSWKIC